MKQKAPATRKAKAAPNPPPQPVLAEIEPPAPAQAPRPLAERLQRPAWLLFSALLCAFYFWAATSSVTPFHPRDTSHDFYNQLTDSFLKGHTYLATKPSPELLALPDPYDPSRNVPHRLNDASLYRGRYYLYFGAAPVVLLYLPWRLVTGTALSDELAAPLFCAIGYGFACLLLFLLLRTSNLNPPLWLRAAAVLALGVGQFSPVVLHHAMIYEVAVIAAYAFLSAGLYFLARAMLQPAGRTLSLCLAGVSLGFSVGSRPHCVLAVLLLAGVYAAFLFRVERRRGRAWWRQLQPLMAPLAVIGLALAWYNFVRFDNPLQFGERYCVTSINVNLPTPWLLSLKQIAASFFYLVLSPPQFLGRFPFFDLNAAAEPWGNPNLFPENYFYEPTGGALLLAPASLGCLLLPWFFRRISLPPALRFFTAALIASGAAMFIGICTLPASTGRYPMDFAPALLTAGIFLLLFVSSGMPGGARRTLFTCALTLALIWGAVVNVCVGVNGYRFPLERAPNSSFRALAAFFGAGPDAVTDTIGSLHYEATVTFAPGEPNHRETLLASGIAQLWDLLFIHYVAPGKVMFSWVHSGISDNWGPWTNIKPGTPRHLVADYSASAKRYTVRLDDEVVLDFPAAFYPTSRDRITTGVMRVGRFGLHDFSGRMENPRLQFVALR